MDVHIRLLGFLGVAALIVITPGVDTALVTRNALMHGRRQAIATALGVNLGIVIWTIAAALGLAAVVRTSTAAFDVLKFAGAAYLIGLGLYSLVTSRAPGDSPRVEASAAVGMPLSARLAFRQGLRSNLLNPKIAVLFTSLLPQFIKPGSSVLAASLVLGVLFNVMGVAWLLAYALAVSRARSLLQNSTTARWLQRLTATVLVGLGVRLATEHR